MQIISEFFGLATELLLQKDPLSEDHVVVRTTRIGMFCYLLRVEGEGRRAWEPDYGFKLAFGGKEVEVRSSFFFIAAIKHRRVVRALAEGRMVPDGYKAQYVLSDSDPDDS